MNLLNYKNPSRQEKLNIWPHQQNNNPALIESMINHENGQSMRIYARKLSAIVIDAKTSRFFLDDNHLDGFATASFHYGLVDENSQLFMVLTIGKSRFSQQHNFEIIRLASLKNHAVIGGASKLLKFAIPDLHGKLLTYSDRKIGDGNVYQKLGFTHLGATKPGYFWMKDNQILSRHQCQKHKLEKLLGPIDLAKTESQIMIEHGWTKVFDFGHDRWELVISDSQKDIKHYQFHYTYKITRPTIDSGFYYGVHSTDDLNDGYLGSGNRIINSIQKYGREVHVKTILKFHESRQLAFQHESELVCKETLLNDDCLNLAIGGQSPNVNYSTKGNNWINNGTKELSIDREALDFYQLRGWKQGRLPTFMPVKTWWIDENNQQRRGIPNNPSRLGRKDSTTSGKKWVLRDGKRMLVDEILQTDQIGFHLEKSNKGKKVILIDGKKKLVDEIPEGATLPVGGTTTGRIGMKSPDGIKKLVLLEEARRLAKLGWAIAAKQIRNCPQHVKDFAKELEKEKGSF